MKSNTAGNCLSFLVLLVAGVEIAHSQLDTIGPINGKTFLIDRLAPVQAATAFTRCHENFATSARIENDEEGRLVVQYMVANDVVYVWLDAIDYPNEGDWHWSNGETLNYTNWAPGQPTIDRSANCMYMDQNSWFYTFRCTSPAGDSGYNTRYLCQVITE